MDWIASKDTILRPDIIVVCGDTPPRHLPSKLIKLSMGVAVVVACGRATDGYPAEALLPVLLNMAVNVPLLQMAQKARESVAAADRPTL